MKTTIYLIRHGEAEGNVFRRLHGQYNSVLLPRGYEQRAYLLKRFEGIHIDAVYSSDLTRARLTAESISVPKGLELHTDPAFREIHVGIWEDLSYGYLDNFCGEKMWQFSHDPVAWHVDGAERYAQYTQRFIQAMEKAALDHPGETIAIFSHGAVLRGTLMHLFFQDRPEQLPLGDNTAVSQLVYESGKFHYEYLNDNSHIPEYLSTFSLQSWWRKTDNRKEANLYFLPLDMAPSLSEALPQLANSAHTMVAILMGRSVGYISWELPEGDLGIISDICIEPGMEGRGYADQLLGTAFSHFRRLGCRRLMLRFRDYPDDVFCKYGFDPVDHTRSISASW